MEVDLNNILGAFFFFFLKLKDSFIWKLAIWKSVYVLACMTPSPNSIVTPLGCQFSNRFAGKHHWVFVYNLWAGL